MNLHPKEIQLIAALPQDPGYQLLCSKIGAYIDELTEELHGADNTRTADLLPYWRAIKTIYSELILSPQAIGKQLQEEEKHEPTTENNPQVNQFLGKFYAEARQKDEDRWQAED